MLSHRSCTYTCLLSCGSDVRGSCKNKPWHYSTAYMVLANYRTSSVKEWVCCVGSRWLYVVCTSLLASVYYSHSISSFMCGSVSYKHSSQLHLDVVLYCMPTWWMMSQFSYNNKEYKDESDRGDFFLIFKNSKKAAHHRARILFTSYCEIAKIFHDPMFWN